MSITTKQKVLNAKELLDYLIELQSYNIDLEKVSLHYREGEDNDIVEIEGVCEDLFDAETNSIPESLLFYSQYN